MSRPAVTHGVALLLASAISSSALAQRAASGDTLYLSLNQSLAIAQRQATAVLVSQDSLQLSGARVLEAYGRFLPDLTAGAAGLVAQGASLISSTALVASDARWRTGAYQLSTSLDVFNGFRDRNNLHVAQFEREASTFSLEQARQQVSFDVLQSYFQVILDRHLAEVARSNLTLSTTRQSQLDAEVRVGTRPPPDLYRQQAQTAADQAAVIDADARTRSDLVGLLQRLRLEPTGRYGVSEPPLDTSGLAPDSLVVDILAARALHERPDLHAADSRVAASNAAVSEAKGLYLPRVFLGFDYLVDARVYDWETQGGVNQLNVPQRSLSDQLGRQGLGILSLGISVPVFDRFETPLAVERARAAANASRLEAEDVRLRVLGDVRRAVDNYQAAAEKLRATESGLVSAQEAFDAVTGRYDVGLGTFIDVLAAQVALTQTRALHEEAAVSLGLQRNVLRYVTGAPIVAY